MDAAETGVASSFDPPLPVRSRWMRRRRRRVVVQPLSSFRCEADGCGGEGVASSFDPSSSSGAKPMDAAERASSRRSTLLLFRCEADGCGGEGGKSSLDPEILAWAVPSRRRRAPNEGGESPFKEPLAASFGAKPMGEGGEGVESSLDPSSSSDAEPMDAAERAASLFGPFSSSSGAKPMDAARGSSRRSTLLLLFRCEADGCGGDGRRVLV